MKYTKRLIKNACPICCKDLHEITCISDAKNDTGQPFFKIIDKVCHNCQYHEETDFCQGKFIKSEILTKKETNNDNNS